MEGPHAPGGWVARRTMRHKRAHNEGRRRRIPCGVGLTSDADCTSSTARSGCEATIPPAIRCFRTPPAAPVRNGRAQREQASPLTQDSQQTDGWSTMRPVIEEIVVRGITTRNLSEG